MRTEGEEQEAGGELGNAGHQRHDQGSVSSVPVMIKGAGESGSGTEAER